MSIRSKKNLAAGFAFLGLVLDFGEDGLIHGATEFYAVDSGRVIPDFEIYS
ncbi:hypothetical protein [Marinobacter sp. MBR-105]